MPKIPTIDAPDARPAGAPDAGIRLDTRGAFGEAKSEELAAANQGVSQVTSEGMRLYAQAQRRAIDADTTQGMTGLQEAWTDLAHNPDSGLFNRRGEDAVNAAQDYYEALDAKRQEISDKLSTQEAKREFALRSGQYMAGAKGEMEKFVSGQVEQVHADTVTLATSAGLNAIRKDPGNDNTAALSYQNMATAVHQLASTDEARASKLSQLKGMVTATRIQSALDQPNPDWQTAQRIYEQSGDTLGEGQEEIRKRITQARAKVTADGMAQKFVVSNLDDSGRPIDGAIQAEVDKMEPGQLREQVRQQTQERTVQATRAYEQAENDRLGRTLTMVERNGGSVNEASDDYQMLSPSNRAKVWERRNTMLRMDKHEQSQVDREELARFSALEPERRAIANINTEFTGASQTTRFTMQAQQNTIKALLLKGQGEPIQEFDTQVKAAGVGVSLQKEDVATLKTVMDGWHHEYMTEHNGKLPSRKEVNEELAHQLTRDGGGLFGFNKRYQFQVPADESLGTPLEGAEQPYQQYLKRSGATPAVGPGTQAGSGGQSSAPAKSVSGYRWNKARTMRMPVYSDGTQGPAEAANGE